MHYSFITVGHFSEAADLLSLSPNFFVNAGAFFLFLCFQRTKTCMNRVPGTLHPAQVCGTV